MDIQLVVNSLNNTISSPIKFYQQNNKQSENLIINNLK